MKDFILVTGPCAAESEQQVMETAQLLHDLSIDILYFRLGVWKPRSKPRDFKGVGETALTWLKTISEKYGFLPCVEVATPEHIDLCYNHHISNVWIGSRTTVNPFLVDNLANAMKGKNLVVMVKNPVVADLKLWIGAIERIQNAGITQVYAIHRGFVDHNETVLRYAPNWDIPIELKVYFPDIPLLCDVSHLCGNVKYLPDMAQIAVDLGFDGLMIETHCNPEKALSDAKQQLTPQQLKTLINNLNFKFQDVSLSEKTLFKQRLQIDSIDHQISKLLKKRVEIVDTIARLKKECQLPIVDAKRFNKVKNIYLADVDSADSYAEFILKYLETLHSFSIKRQK
jgi:chorismate mutase